MPIELKAPLSTYFEAANAHDAAGVAALFGEGALIHDENADHRGRPAIRDWAQGTYDQYDVRQTPRGARREGSAIFVTTGVVGTFPVPRSSSTFGFSSTAPDRGAQDRLDQPALTKLSSTFLRPECSKSISSLLPSIAAMMP